MKILQINKLYAPVIGGVETVVRDIAEGLNNLTDMAVLVCQRKGRHQKESYNGVKVTRAGSFGMFLSMPLSVDFFRCYKKMAQSVDIIQLHAPFPLEDLAVLLFKHRGKLVVWWHCDIVRQKLSLKLLAPIIRHTLEKADLIIVADEENIHSSVFLPHYVDKCVIIPYGLDFAAYPSKPSNENFLTEKLRDKSHKKLLFVGRLVYYKGVDVLIKAMQTVEGAELFIIGNGALEQKLKDYTRQWKLEDKIHFLGAQPRDDLLGAFYDCDVFVFPSVAKTEAFGLCQLEAMFYGKPVINTNLPTAVSKVSINGETGITTPCGDAEGLAEAIKQLIRDDKLREIYGKNAALRVRTHFDKTQMIHRLYACYKSLL